jgi:hypothetical protein
VRTPLPPTETTWERAVGHRLACVVGGCFTQARGPHALITHFQSDHGMDDDDDDGAREAAVLAVEIWKDEGCQQGCGCGDPLRTAFGGDQ